MTIRPSKGRCVVAADVLQVISSADTINEISRVIMRRTDCTDISASWISDDILSIISAKISVLASETAVAPHHRGERT